MKLLKWLAVLPIGRGKVQYNVNYLVLIYNWCIFCDSSKAVDHSVKYCSSGCFIFAIAFSASASSSFLTALDAMCLFNGQ